MKKDIDEYLLTVLEEGDTFYHYTSAEGLQGILGGEFWITESHFLNDITEFHIATDVFSEVIDYNLNDETTKERIKRAVSKSLELFTSDDIQDDEKVGYDGYYVISFCLDKDSILMWSEYSDFCGYCIEFDFDKLIHSFSNSTQIKHGKVIYEHEEQVSMLQQIIENDFFQSQSLFPYVSSWEDFASINDKQLAHFSLHMATVVHLYNMFFKKECFSGENEYRFVFSCDHNKEILEDSKKEEQYFRIKDNVLIPFVKKKLSSLDFVNSILIGPKNNSDIAEKGVKHFLRYHKIKAKVEKSEMPLRY